VTGIPQAIPASTSWGDTAAVGGHHKLCKVVSRIGDIKRMVRGVTELQKSGQADAERNANLAAGVGVIGAGNSAKRHCVVPLWETANRSRPIFLISASSQLFGTPANCRGKN
jgi:hypothetical protein